MIDYDTVRLVCKTSWSLQPIENEAKTNASEDQNEKANRNARCMIRESTLWRLIQARAESTPSWPMAVDHRDRKISFSEYHHATLRAAAGLREFGVGPGKIVSWILPSWIESMVLIGALARLDAIQNPILPIYRARELGFIARQCKPSLLISPATWRGFDYASMAAAVAAEHPDLKTLIVDQELPDGDPANLPSPAEPRLPNKEKTRWIFYTSGTTADPKGVRHSDSSLYAAATGMGEALQLSASDRIAFVFPLTHIGGINWLQAGLTWGCQQIVIENFAAHDTMSTLRRHGVTLGTAGTVFHEAYLAAHRQSDEKPLFPRLRGFPGGGAPKPAQLHFDLKREMGGVGILSGYGLTEAPILSMGAVDDSDEKLAKTEGLVALGSVDLRVVRGDGQLAMPGEEGEFRVRARQLFRGYVDSALDLDAFDQNGYFRTGDLGHLDEDGYVVVTGRQKDVIIRKGETISAREIESLLEQHPKVSDVAVIGLPDQLLGERCCAVVACSDQDEKLGIVEMKSFLIAKQLMLQKIPEQLEIVESLPRNPTGKILKLELKKRFANC